MSPVRVTVAVAVVLRVFLDDPPQPRYGYELMRLTGYPSGKLYPILARLQGWGWLLKEQEDVDPAVVGRPVRRLYHLSAHGVEEARHELAVVNERLRSPVRPTGAPRPEGSRP